MSLMARGDQDKAHGSRDGKRGTLKTPLWAEGKMTGKA
jgi:hypothetical protein